MRVFVLYPLSHIYGGLRHAAATLQRGEGGVF